MIFEESGLRFEFNDNSWSHLIAYDKTKDYEKLKNAIPETKGVDFLGILNNVTLAIFEVKNFKGHRIENKPKLVGGNNPLWLEVAQKIRDTIAGIIGGVRHSTNLDMEWNAHASLLTQKEKKVHILLWLEQDIPRRAISIKQKKVMDDTLKRQLKKSLSWLSNRVDVVDRNSNPFPTQLTVFDI